MTVTWDLLLQALVPVLTKRLLDDHLFPQVQFSFVIFAKTGLRIFCSSLKGHSCDKVTVLVGEVQRLSAMHCIDY